MRTQAAGAALALASALLVAAAASPPHVTSAAPASSGQGTAAVPSRPRSEPAPLQVPRAPQTSRRDPTAPPPWWTALERPAQRLQPPAAGPREPLPPLLPPPPPLPQPTPALPPARQQPARPAAPEPAVEYLAVMSGPGGVHAVLRIGTRLVVLRVGESDGSLRLLSATDDSAEVRIAGKTRKLRMGPLPAPQRNPGGRPGQP